MKEKSLANPDAQILVTIKSQLQNMNPAQKRIAKYVLENTQKVESISIGNLAKESRVSEATISRFVKFLGCTNYREFQTEMVKNNFARNGRIRGYANIGEMDEDDIRKSCKGVFDMNVQCLQDTFSILDYDAIRKTAELIAKSGALHIFAQGRSVVTALSIKHRLQRLGILCCHYSDSHEQAVAASLRKKGDVVMGISTFGRSRMVLKNLRIASTRGATVIGVSGYRGTPLEDIADIMLVSSSNEESEFGFEPSCATVAQMIILDCVYLWIANYLKEEAGRCFQLTYSAIESERE